MHKCCPSTYGVRVWHTLTSSSQLPRLSLTYSLSDNRSHAMQVENFGRLRYERSREALAHGHILTQRHEATNVEIAMAEGDRPLVSEQLLGGLAVKSPL